MERVYRYLLEDDTTLVKLCRSSRTQGKSSWSDLPEQVDKLDSFEEFWDICTCPWTVHIQEDTTLIFF